jgi:hypothetical protein
VLRQLEQSRIKKSHREMPVGFSLFVDQMIVGTPVIFNGNEHLDQDISQGERDAAGFLRGGTS